MKRRPNCPEDVYGLQLGMSQTFRNYAPRGQEVIALNGGPDYQFSPAISLFVNCETQEEIDQFWEKLSEGGETLECGWLKDQYGISWQIVPTIVGEMLKAKETDKTHRMLKALWQMQKLDIKRLMAAFDGRE
jgi:predicted 3-demethylubiquinone-9 3-methyltransferase (glyoxalase superfamily)